MLKNLTNNSHPYKNEGKEQHTLYNFNIKTLFIIWVKITNFTVTNNNVFIHLILMCIKNQYICFYYCPANSEYPADPTIVIMNVTARINATILTHFFCILI